MTKTWAHLHLPRFSKGINACISIKRLGEKVVYDNVITLRDVTFVVHGAGRKRTLETGVRNVHAWCVGTEMPTPLFVDWSNWKRAVYDPFKSEHFVDAQTLRPLLKAAIIVMHGKNVYYKVGTYA